MADRQEILERLAGLIRRVMNSPHAAIGRTTTAMEVDGWDSLSNTILMLEVEAEFRIRLPLDQIHALPDVGALADLVALQLDPEAGR